MKTAVVGHVEWVQFLRVNRIPQPGDIVHAESWWEQAAGGGAVAAVQLAKLAGNAAFFTALGDDELGHQAFRELTAMGLDVKAVFRPEPQRRAVTHIDAAGERAITVAGARLSPQAGDGLPWEELEDADAVFLTGGDAGAITRARSARMVTATSRILPVLIKAGIRLDALIGSGSDPAESYHGELDPPPDLLVLTSGRQGGMFKRAGRAPQSYRSRPLEGPVADTYGAGDSFAAALTFGLASGLGARQAIELAARCAAAVVTGDGPYSGQLGVADLDHHPSSEKGQGPNRP